MPRVLCTLVPKQPNASTRHTLHVIGDLRTDVAAYCVARNITYFFRAEFVPLAFTARALSLKSQFEIDAGLCFFIYFYFYGSICEGG